MNESTSSPKKQTIVPLVTAMLVVGIALAAWELWDLYRVFSTHHATLVSITGHRASAPVVSVVLARGLVHVGVVEHPYTVVAIGNFVLGALAGALGFGLFRGTKRIFRRTHYDNSRNA